MLVDGIRTRERLRDKALNLAPLTWLGNPLSRSPVPGEQWSCQYRYLVALFLNL